jgi:hypothetical protein
VRAAHAGCVGLMGLPRALCMPCQGTMGLHRGMHSRALTALISRLGAVPCSPLNTMPLVCSASPGARLFAERTSLTARMRMDRAMLLERLMSPSGSTLRELPSFMCIPCALVCPPVLSSALADQCSASMLQNQLMVIAHAQAPSPLTSPAGPLLVLGCRASN